MMKRRTPAWMFAVPLFGGAGACALGQPAHFSDQTLSSGLVATSTALSATEADMMSGGLAVGDFNNDGWPDVFVLGGPGAPDKLFINTHDGTFIERGAQWGVDRTHRGFGIAVGDYDNDGWLDIFITSGGSNGTACHHILYHNNGNGTFTDVAGLAHVQCTTVNGFDGFGAAWGDYDLDGRLDLAVSGYMYGMNGGRLFHNNGDGTFTDATAALGVGPGGAPALATVLGFTPVFVDMDGDRSPELLWISDFGTSRYFVNNRNGTFHEATAAAGVGLEGNGMGVTVGDFNGDGRPDYYVTSVYTLAQGHPGVPGTGNMLYLNTGGNHFQEVGASAGVRQGGWGWGTVAADLRNLGRVDIVETNGWQGSNYGGEFLADPTCVFLNASNGTFASAATACGVTHTALGRGMVTLDYDRDGREDVIIATNGGPLTLYRNDSPPANWVSVALTTRASHGLAPNGYGAHVVVTSDGVDQHRWITGASSFLSQSELGAHFGLGSAAIARVRVEWPNGTVGVRTGIPANQAITISSCPGDANADGRLGVDDIFAFINTWFAGGSGADFNANGVIAVQDIFDFLNAWFSGC